MSGSWALGLDGCAHLAEVLDFGCSKNHIVNLSGVDVWPLPHTSKTGISGAGADIGIFLKVPHLILTVARDENYWNRSLSNVSELGKMF